VSQMTNELDFDSHEHVWQIRVPFDEYESMTAGQRLQLQSMLRLLAKTLGIQIEAGPA